MLYTILVEEKAFAIHIEYVMWWIYIAIGILRIIHTQNTRPLSTSTQESNLGQIFLLVLLYLLFS